MTDVTYVTPTGSATWITLADLAAMVLKLRTDVDALKAVSAASSGSTPVKPPLDPNWLVNQTVTSGASLMLPGGVETGTMSTAVPLSIGGIGMRNTILDGQGGVGAGPAMRLAEGKGIIHAGAGITVSDIGFINGGGADGVSDGEAGFYVEGFTSFGTATLVRCAFDKCENGVYMPKIALANVALAIDRCVFGARGANGLADGRSHDMYVAGASVLIANSVFAGTSRGNTIKCRGPKLGISGSYIGRSNGRWIDAPGGAAILSTGNLYVTQPGAGSANAFGFYDEADDTANPGQFGSFLSTSDTFVFSRANETIWINNAATKVQFVSPTVKWVGAKGSTPPVVTIQGPGQITGANPFTPAAFTEANRVDAGPLVPTDPVS